jgi:hypothetical protein
MQLHWWRLVSSRYVFLPLQPIWVKHATEASVTHLPGNEVVRPFEIDSIADHLDLIEQIAAWH